MVTTDEVLLGCKFNEEKMVVLLFVKLESLIRFIEACGRDNGYNLFVNMFILKHEP